MKKALVVVDMQNDFIDGALANEQAKKIVPAIVKKISDFDGDVFATRDTHFENYMQSYEGKHLPIPHCIENTCGWHINESIRASVEAKNGVILDKATFGSVDACNIIACKDYDVVEFVGTCTDICVVSNVMILKSLMPETHIVVHADMCAGLTKEKHEAALETMRSCQVEVL